MKLTLNNGSVLEFDNDAQLLAFIGQPAFDALKQQTRTAVLQPPAPSQNLPVTGGQQDQTTSLAAALAAALVAAQQVARDGDDDEDRLNRKPAIRRINVNRLERDTPYLPVSGGGHTTYEDAHSRLSPVQSVGLGGALAAAIGVALAKSFFDSRD